MTEQQQYLNDGHLANVERAFDKIEAAGFELRNLAVWYGGQPNTEFTHPSGKRLLVFGYARCGLYRGDGTKIDACKLNAWSDDTLDRVLAKAAI